MGPFVNPRWSIGPTLSLKFSIDRTDLWSEVIPNVARPHF
jgi:hypothetical protein